MEMTALHLEDRSQFDLMRDPSGLTACLKSSLFVELQPGDAVLTGRFARRCVVRCAKPCLQAWGALQKSGLSPKRSAWVQASVAWPYSCFV
jgi:hypothetical protein